MISIQSVYESVKDLANKDQKGFVTPEIFNSFAKIAQLNIYYEMFSDLPEGNKARRMNVDPSRNLSIVNRAKGDLSTFIEKATLINDEVTGNFVKPNDFHSVISVVDITTVTAPSNGAICHLLYDEDKIQHILNSTLSAPSTEFPVALISSDIEVFHKTSIKKIQLSYYRSPITPSYQVFLSGSNSKVELFNPSASQDFELPYHYEQDLVYEIAKMIGVNIRDQQVEVFGRNEDNQS